MKRKIGAALAVVLLCGSCTRDFIVEPSGLGTAIQLTFFDPGTVRHPGWVESGWPFERCVSQLRVREEQWPRQPGQVICQISTSGRCVRLREVEIGKVPGGFVETVNHLPLRTGRMYRATARAGPASGVSKPWMVCPEAPTVLRWDDEYWLVNPPRQC